MSGDGALRRVADRGAALAVLLLILPALLALGAVVRVTLGGPVLVREVRHGPRGTALHLWVLRTRSTGRESALQRRVGAFLRRTSLDELPGFINVLEGSVAMPALRQYSRSRA